MFTAASKFDVSVSKTSSQPSHSKTTLPFWRSSILTSHRLVEGVGIPRPRQFLVTLQDGTQTALQERMLLSELRDVHVEIRVSRSTETIHICCRAHSFHAHPDLHEIFRRARRYWVI